MKKAFTLVEVMVAIFIFVLIIIAAYQIYERSQKTYILGEQLSDLQQNVRFAYEQISYDLRVAGFNVYPDDESTRPDEQIEGAWRGAIAIRSDFDPNPVGDEYTCDDTDNNRMCDNGTGAFMAVSTDNSEIRIYALAKKPNDPNGETIKFLADLSKPRDAKLGEIGNLEKISITGVAINQTNPPYTLYRITIDPAANIGSGAEVPQSSLIWTPIASNIYSLQFTYYSEKGIDPNNIITPDENDISSKEMDYLKKHGYPFGAAPTNFIKNVQFILKGVTQNPDPRWVDRSDPYQTTKNKRKVELSSTIVLKNVGVAPHELADTVPPDGPTALDSTTGYCNGVLLTWDPSMALDVTSYYIQAVDEALYTSWSNSFKYNCDDFPQTCTIISTPEAHANRRVGWYLPNLTMGTKYYARVFSQDKAGNFSMDATNTVDFEITPNPIKPKPPQFSIFSEDVYNGLNRLIVGFLPPEGYDDSQVSACKEPPATEDAYFSSKVRDLYGYRLYHKRFPTSTANDFGVDEEGNKVATEVEEAGVGKIDNTRTSYPDIKACPCEYYAYKMRAVTSCATLGPVGNPSCTFLSNLSDVSTDNDLNPKAYLIPEFQDFSANPQIVPAKPISLFASSSEVSPENYSVNLTFPIGFGVVQKDTTKSPPEFTPYPEDMKTECWRYKVYMYMNDEDANNNENAIEIIDSNLFGDGDLNDWDAGIDGGVENLIEGTRITFNIGEFNIPSGEKRYFRIAGYYRCGSGDYLGELSPPASVPCEIAYNAAIIDPPRDNMTISQPTYNIVLQITGLPAGVTINEVKFRIPNPYNEQYSTSCVGSPNCQAIFPWNNTSYPDGTYLITATVNDSNGCSLTLQRWVIKNTVCGQFQIWLPPNPISEEPDQITFKLQKLDSLSFVLLKGISFNSSGSYLYDYMQFYEGDPSSNPYIRFWGMPGYNQNMDNQWIGLGYPHPYDATNWCGYFRLYPDPTNSSKENWFRLDFDKNITPSNGPLNLSGSFHYQMCNGSKVINYNLNKNTSSEINLNMITCSYQINPTTPKKPTVTADFCTGYFKLYCPPAGAGGCEGDFIVSYPNSDLLCTDIPIFIGP